MQVGLDIMQIINIMASAQRRCTRCCNIKQGPDRKEWVGLCESGIFKWPAVRRVGCSPMKIRMKRFSRKWNSMAKAVRQGEARCVQGFTVIGAQRIRRVQENAGTGSASCKNLPPKSGSHIIIKSNRLLLCRAEF